MIRSAFFWVLTWLHFLLLCPVVLLLGLLVGHRRADPVVRWFCRNVVRCAGTRLRVEGRARLDGLPPCLFVTNHVNLFDPFFLCAALPPVTRGLELESHFRIPLYGWLMKRFGNVPVPDERSAASLKRTYRLAREALEQGINLIVFPEGSRTRDGRVGPFEEGAFRMARKLGAPLVPVTLRGMYTFHPTGSRRLGRGPVTVVVHPPIDLAGVRPSELAETKRRVRETIADALESGPEGPVEGNGNSPG